ncbi:Fur family transcriptional regulator [Leucothrix arctica]|uniref:Transcriptional repressor n=1 Tax=Leucothrix arctica TaxID=1481894 RepID=A0A317C3J3_9GAMM|nr:Fur family transcriptional regulator [Leucothrix arctica]PWQ93194.1 transcriptional repressor [Leucothrix arctica]
MGSCQHESELAGGVSQRIDTIINHAEQHCKTHGVRLTDKRKQLLSVLIGSEKALSAYELIDLCKAEFGKAIPAMSVYRMLQFLEDERLVHKLNLANKYVACAHISCDHAHSVSQFLICGECSKVDEISVPKQVFAELEKNVEEAGFHLITPQLEINCICNDCKKGNKH